MLSSLPAQSGRGSHLKGCKLKSSNRWLHSMTLCAVGLSLLAGSCIAAWPGQYPAGAVRQQLVSSMDWLPTLAGHAGIDTSSMELDGSSLEGTIASSAAGGHEFLCWAYGEGWAIRHGRWKLIGKGAEEMALYDLLADPGESRDVLNEQPEVFRRLANARNAWADELLRDPTVRRELGV